MVGVPRIYGLLANGTSDAQFRRMTAADAPAAARELAATYRHLFSTSPSAQPLRADLGPDGQLTVVAGQHRVCAARAAGVALLPVHVRAVDDRTLRALRARLEPDARALQPAAVEVHRRYDDHWRQQRVSEQTRARWERGWG